MFIQHKDGWGMVAELWQLDKQKEKQSLQTVLPDYTTERATKKSVMIPHRTENLPHDSKYAGSKLNLKSVNGDGWRNIFHPHVLFQINWPLSSYPICFIVRALGFLSPTHFIEKMLLCTQILAINLVTSVLLALMGMMRVPTVRQEKINLGIFLDQTTANSQHSFTRQTLNGWIW